MSASKKINLMALIRTLTISTTTFERMKEKFDGFRQTESRAGFYFLQRLHFETIAKWSSKLQRVTCLQQLAMDFLFQRCDTRWRKLHTLQSLQASTKNLRDKLQRGHVTHYNLSTTCLVTPLRDKLQVKGCHVTLALDTFESFQLSLVRIILSTLGLHY